MLKSTIFVSVISVMLVIGFVLVLLFEILYLKRLLHIYEEKDKVNLDYQKKLFENNKEYGEFTTKILNHLREMNETQIDMNNTIKVSLDDYFDLVNSNISTEKLCAMVLSTCMDTERKLKNSIPRARITQKKRIVK